MPLWLKFCDALNVVIVCEYFLSVSILMCKIILLIIYYSIYTAKRKTPRRIRSTPEITKLIKKIRLGKTKSKNVMASGRHYKK